MQTILRSGAVRRLQSKLFQSNQSNHFQQRWQTTKQTWPAPRRRQTTHRNWKEPARTSTPNGYKSFPNRPNTSGTPWLTYTLIVTSGSVCAYIYLNLDYAPFTNRARLIGMSRAREQQLGQATLDHLLHEVGDSILPNNHIATHRVLTIARRLVSSAQQLDGPSANALRFRVIVADIPDVNAMCVPGGTLLVTTGLLTALRTDDQIAIVLGHEIGHALARHGVENLRVRQIIYAVLLMLRQLLDFGMFASLLSNLLVALPYSRKLELEADLIGVLLCAQACFDISVAPAVFDLLADLQDAPPSPHLQSRLSGFLSTHPPSRERALRLRQMLPDLLRDSEQRCSQRFPAFARSGMRHGLDGDRRSV